MEIKEIVTNLLEIDDDTIKEYLERLDSDETPSVRGLIDYIEKYYYLPDFYDTTIDCEYYGNNLDFNKYLI